MSEQTSTVFGAGGNPAGAEGSGGEDPVSLLVGEGKKFKTVQDLAKGKLEADTFVERLKTENKALREAILAGTDTTDIQARIDELQASTKKDDSATGQPKGNQTQTEPLTAEKVLDLLDKREQAKTLQKNSDLFNSTIQKALGDKASETVLTRIQNLGLDLETFNTLVARNPQSALALVGLKETPSASGNVGSKTGGVNTAALFSSNAADSTENFAYFNKLRKELGSGYFAPEVQKRVFEARKRLGDAFWK